MQYSQDTNHDAALYCPMGEMSDYQRFFDSLRDSTPPAAVCDELKALWWARKTIGIAHTNRAGPRNRRPPRTCMPICIASKVISKTPLLVRRAGVAVTEGPLEQRMGSVRRAFAGSGFGGRIPHCAVRRRGEGAELANAGSIGRRPRRSSASTCSIRVLRVSALESETVVEHRRCPHRRGACTTRCL